MRHSDGGDRRGHLNAPTCGLDVPLDDPSTWTGSGHELEVDSGFLSDPFGEWGGLYAARITCWYRGRGGHLNAPTCGLDVPLDDPSTWTGSGHELEVDSGSGPGGRVVK